MPCREEVMAVTLLARSGSRIATLPHEGPQLLEKENVFLEGGWLPFYREWLVSARFLPVPQIHPLPGSVMIWTSK
jgi:hypothetical protein